MAWKHDVLKISVRIPPDWFFNWKFSIENFWLKIFNWKFDIENFRLKIWYWKLARHLNVENNDAKNSAIINGYRLKIIPNHYIFHIVLCHSASFHIILYSIFFYIFSNHSVSLFLPINQVHFNQKRVGGIG